MKEKAYLGPVKELNQEPLNVAVAKFSTRNGTTRVAWRMCRDRVHYPAKQETAT